MRRLGFDRFLGFFSLSNNPKSCLCMNPMEEEEEEEEDKLERKALMKSHVEQKLKLGDGSKPLAFHLEPKTVVLRVSMHCNGCAKKVEKHISKMEGVTSFQVDLESKKVVVMGDITPFEVLESVSKVKFAELWVARESSKSALFDEGTNTQSSSSH